jgi:dihydroorotase
MATTLIRNANIVNEGRIFKGSVFIKGEVISEIYKAGHEPDTLSPAYVIDAKDKFLIPGVIDDQVHFRQPGLTHKADIYTESRAAVAGGVTSVMDMPNTNPQTITQRLLEQKYEMGERFSLANYSFYIGATNDNLKELLKTDPKKVCGIKVFMGSSTGNMKVEDPQALENIFKESPLLIATHCEDEQIITKNLAEFSKKYNEDIPVACHPLIRSAEACYKSTSGAVEMAEKFGSRLHVLHLSSAREMELFSNKKKLNEKRITSEVCIHHLWFSDKDYEKYGNFIKWNPSIKTEADRLSLWEALLDGRLDVIATDHAPHTLKEKQDKYLKTPSGGPLVQHLLVAMLEFYLIEKISLETIIDKMCHAPATVYNIEKRGFIRTGYYADLVLLDMNSPWTVGKNNLLYKCGWSPFEGTTFNSSVTHTFINGHLVYDKGNINERFRGMRLAFDR